MPGYRGSGLNSLAHDMAMKAADAETVAPRKAHNDAWRTYCDVKRAYEEAHYAAYDKAYEKLEKQYGE